MSFQHCGTLLTGVVLAVSLGLSPAFAQDFVPGEFIVKMKGRASGSKSAAFMGKMSGKMALKATYGKLNMHHMTLKPGEDLNAAMNDLRNDPDVEYVEPNYILRKFDGEVAGADARIYSADEAHSMTAQNSAMGTYSQSRADTKVDQAWGAMTTSVSDTPIVAVIDTGVDYNHSIFVNSGAIWINPGETGTDAAGHNRASNGIDDDGNGYIDDVRGWNFNGKTSNPMDDDNPGHGTHVAGIILGVGQDIFAPTLAPAKIRIMPLKFLGADGSGATTDAISAIYYAVNNGASVINNSWGGGSYSQALHDALTFAYTHSVVLVAAAGNAGNNNDTKAMYPANYPVPSLISVAATNDWDTLASFSNYGVATVHMGAPGVGIYSSVRNQSFSYMSGTSMAAPFVSGLAALAVREAPRLSGYQIRNLIVNSSTPINGLVPRVSSGSRVNTFDTVVHSKTESGVTRTQPDYTAASASGARAPAADSASMSPGGCGLVSTSVMTRTFDFGKGPSAGGGSSNSPIGLVVAMTLLPLLVWQVVRAKAAIEPKQRRRHERFVMNSEIKVRVGDRELVGQMSTISLGGLSFKADAMLERGGVVTVQIASPDGGDQVQVEGRIVWNEQNQGYGVQFDGAKDNALNSIRGWTKDLVKAS